MNILITGANGFIGRNLVKKLLLHQENKIIGVSRASSIYKSHQYMHIKADITNPKWFEKVKLPVDTVIHLAQSKDYRCFPEKALDILQTNVLATSYLLDWSKNNNVKKFIFTSSGNVYKQKNSLLTENDVCDPNSFYGATKLSSELLIRQYKQYFDVTILRLFGVYGKDQKNMLIPNITHSIKDMKEIKLVDEEGLFITPLFIDDCILILKLFITKKKTKHTVYNISGSEIMSLRQIVYIISKKVKKKPIINNILGKPTYFIGSNKRFMSEFNFNQQLIPFIKGVQTLC